MTTETHKNVYARVFAELGSDKFYNTPFLTLAEKYGEEHFPKEFAALAESHPDSEFNIAFVENNDAGSQLADYFVDPNTIKDAALWMLTENWTGTCGFNGPKYTQAESVTILRHRLRAVNLRDRFLNDEQAQMLLDLLNADPEPYWTK
jgi:hypothetical protein